MRVKSSDTGEEKVSEPLDLTGVLRRRGVDLYVAGKRYKEILRHPLVHRWTNCLQMVTRRVYPSKMTPKTQSRILNKAKKNLHGTTKGLTTSQELETSLGLP